MKFDRTGYMYEGRSYGVGAAVGLHSSPVVGHTESYHFPETGYLVDATCIHNQCSDFTLSGPILDTHDRPGVPIMFWAQGRRPNNDWKANPNTAPGFYPMPGWGPTPDDVVAWSAGSCCNTNNGTAPFHLSIVAGKRYGAFDKVQCQINFRPTSFDVSVFVSNRTIRVRPLHDAVVSDPEPRGMLREWMIRDLQSLPEVQSTLYVSTIGEALKADAINLLNKPTLNVSDLQRDNILPATETSVAAAIDDILSSLAGSAFTQSESWESKSDVSFAISSIRIGLWRYTYPLFVINIIALATIALVAIRSRMFAESSAFDFTDLFAMAAAASNGTIAQDETFSGANLTRWNGDPSDRVLSHATLDIDQCLEPSRPLAIQFRHVAQVS